MHGAPLTLIVDWYQPLTIWRINWCEEHSLTLVVLSAGLRRFGTLNAWSSLISIDKRLALGTVAKMSLKFQTMCTKRPQKELNHPIPTERK
jgi:hypothetical protein